MVFRTTRKKTRTSPSRATSFIMKKVLVHYVVPLTILAVFSASTVRGAILPRLENGEQLRIAAIGTSLTDPHGGNNWFAQMEAWLSKKYPEQVMFSNRGVGATASVNLPNFNRPHGGEWQLEQVLANDDPDVIFIEFAVNDAYKEFKMSPDDSAKSLQRLIDRILSWAKHRQKTVEIIVQTMNNTGDSYAKLENDVGPYYEAWRKTAAANRLLLIDHYQNWIQLYNSESDHAAWKSYVPDGVHPNPLGATKIILPEIQRVLESQLQKTKSK